MKLSDFSAKLPYCYLEQNKEQFWLYNCNSGKKKKISQTGVIIWELCDGKRSIADIIDILENAFYEDKNSIMPDIIITLNYFSSYSFICFDPKEIKKKLFIKAVLILKSNNIPFFVTAGILLGWRRDNSFIPWDADIDFGVWKHKVEEKTVIDAFEKEGFTIDNLLPFGMDAIQIFYKNYNITIDIGFYSKQGKNAVYKSNYQDSKNRKIDLKYIVPAAIFENLKTVNMFGEQVSIPKNTEAYLEACYGAHWRTPKIYQNWHQDATYKGGEP
ncbi:MAG: PqqD family peptide modification chaperone [Deltaproteobacteria bacterium]|nr:PqqD family peptide modification chaperone [Deltaproteobacteria bacterium]